MYCCSAQALLLLSVGCGVPPCRSAFFKAGRCGLAELGVDTQRRTDQIPRLYGAVDEVKPDADTAAAGLVAM